MILIDTHAHLNFSAYKSDAGQVIGRSLAKDTWMINVGSQYSTSKKAVEIAGKYKKGVYAAVGLHPIHSQDGFDFAGYRKMAQAPGVVAIGETGLDYKKEYVSFKEKQKEVFLEQLDLAKELNLPIILHCRMAHQDLINLLSPEIRGVVHCFTGNWQQAEKYLAMGFYLGFNGIIFKLDLDEIIKKTPLNRILLETDCPYLTPLPAEALAKAGPQPIRNEPLYVKYVAEKIAEIKNTSFEETIKAATENASKLFGL